MCIIIMNTPFGIRADDRSDYQEEMAENTRRPPAHCSDRLTIGC